MKNQENKLFQEEMISFGQAGGEEIFSKNLAALFDRNPDLAKRIERASVEQIFLFRSKRGAMGLKLGEDYLTSKYDPEGEMNGQVAEALSTKPDVLLLFGLGLGYHLPEVAKNHQARMVLYEPDVRVLRTALSITDFSELIGRERFLLIDDLRDMNFNFQFDHGAKIKPTYHQLALASYKRLYPDKLEEFTKQMKVVQRDSDIAIETYLVKSKTWFEYLFENMPDIYKLPSVNELRNKFNDMPVVIVASGPSLDKNIDYLAQAKGRACIISVGTALKKLVARKIVPDVVVAVESNDIYYQFEGVKELEEAFLILRPACNPKLFKLQTKGTFVFSDIEIDQIWAMLRLGKQGSVIKNGGSVACTAFAIAHIMGAQSITLVGQDLALGSDGHSHAEGTGEASGKENFFGDVLLDPAHRKELNSQNLELVEGYNGGYVATRFHWLNYKLWYERRIKEYSSHGIRFINSTEGGVRIHGMEQLPLAAVIEQVFPEKLPERPTDRLARLAMQQQLKPIQEVLDELEQDLQNLLELRQVSGQTTPMIKRIFGLLKKKSINEQTVNTKLTKLEKLEKRFLELSEKVDTLITPVTRTEMVIVNNCFQEDSDDEISNLRHNLNRSHLLHNAIHNGTLRVIPMMQRLLDRLWISGQPVKSMTCEHQEVVSCG